MIDSEYRMNTAGLQRLCDAAYRHCPAKWRTSNWIPYHDNAPAYVCQNKLIFGETSHSVASTSSILTWLPVASCSHIRRKHWKFADSVMLKRFKQTWQDKWRCLHKWQDRWNKFIHSQGDYYEGDQTKTRSISQKKNFSLRTLWTGFV